MLKDFFYGIFDFLNGMYNDFTTGDLFTQIVLLFLALLVLGVILIPILFLLNYLLKNKRYSKFLKTKAKIISLSYKPDDVHIGIGTGISPNGNITSVTTTTFEDEKFNVVLRTEEIGRIIIENENLFNHVETNQEIELEYVKKYTKYIWQNKFKFDDYIPQRAYVNGKRIEL